MNFPEMILFDYGHTLISESPFNGIRGSKAILKYASSNTHGLSAEQISQFSTQLFHDLGVYARNNGIEVHQHMFQRMLYEYLDIEVDLSPLEMEQVFWDHASPGKAMPFIEETLDYLHSHHIRTGVISNISFSEDALSDRINRLLPNNHFEFIIPSSEYIYRKPNPIIFEIALRKAKLSPDKVWFCGDNLKADIMGAHSAHLFPVWYENDSAPYTGLDPVISSKELATSIDFDYLHIKAWPDLIRSLESL